MAPSVFTPFSRFLNFPNLASDIYLSAIGNGLPFFHLRPADKTVEVVYEEGCKTDDH